MMNENQFKGFELFKDIDDVALRTRNRAVVLANIAEDNTKARRISLKGVNLILGYFSAIPENERAVARTAFQDHMQERGYVVA